MLWFFFLFRQGQGRFNGNKIITGSEIKSTLSRIRQSVDAILPDKAKSKPSERVQMYDYSFAPSVEEEPPHGCSRQSSIKKGLAFLFGEN